MKNVLESLVERKTDHKAVCPGLQCPGMLKEGASKGHENSFALSSLGQDQGLSCPELFVTQAMRGSYSHRLA